MEEKNYITFIVGQLLRDHLAKFDDMYMGNKFQACSSIADDILKYQATTCVADRIGWYETAKLWVGENPTLVGTILHYYCIGYED